MKRKLTWLILSVLTIGFAVAATVYHIQWAENILMFWLWVVICLTPFSLTKKFIEILREKGRMMPVLIDDMSDIIVLTMIIGDGWFVTGAFYFIALLIQEVAWIKAKK